MTLLVIPEMYQIGVKGEFNRAKPIFMKIWMPMKFPVIFWPPVEGRISQILTFIGKFPEHEQDRFMENSLNQN